MKRYMLGLTLVGVLFASPRPVFGGGLLGEIGDRVTQGVNDLANDLSKPPEELLRRAAQARDDLLKDIERSGYTSNKPELMEGVEEGGWIAAWSQDITETDAIEGIVAAGISIAGENPAPFLEWVENLTDRTLMSLQENAMERFPAALRTQLRNVAATALKEFLTDYRRLEGDMPQITNTALRDFVTFDFKAGGIIYSGKNVLADRVISRTGGIKLYVAFRWHAGAHLKPKGQGMTRLEEMQENWKQSYTGERLQGLTKEDSLGDLVDLSGKLSLFHQALTARNLDTAQVDRVNRVALDEIQRIRKTVLDLRQADGVRRALLILGFKPGRVGDPETTRAVREFQMQHHLVVDGIVGNQTRTALRTALDKVGVPHEQPTPIDLATPKGIQRALFVLGFDPGPVDGDLGPQTRRAIKAFQRAKRLVVDGIVGPQTRGALRTGLDAIGMPHRN